MNTRRILKSLVLLRIPLAVICWLALAQVSWAQQGQTGNGTWQESRTFAMAARAGLKTVYTILNGNGEHVPSVKNWLVKDNPEFAKMGLNATGGVSFYRLRGPRQITFFVASDETHLILAFRGTETHTNWLSNGLPFKDAATPDGRPALEQIGWGLTELDALINGMPVQTEQFGNELVHNGWQLNVASVWPDIVRELQVHQAEKKTVVVTGHSLGGALAGYTMFRLLSETNFLDRNHPHLLATFAAPHYSLQTNNGAPALVAAEVLLKSSGNLRRIEGDFDEAAKRAAKVDLNGASKAVAQAVEDLKNLKIPQFPSRHSDFQATLQSLIATKAPNAKAYAVESHGPNGVDLITVSWDLQGLAQTAHDQLVKPFKKMHASMTTKVLGKTVDFTPSGIESIVLRAIDAISVVGREGFGTSVPFGEIVAIPTTETDVFEVHDCDKSYFSVLSAGFQFKGRFQKMRSSNADDATTETSNAEPSSKMAKGSLTGDWRDSHGGEIQIIQTGNQIVAIGKNEAVTRWWDRATATLEGQSLTMTYTLAGQETDIVNGTILDLDRIQWGNESNWQRVAKSAPNMPNNDAATKDVRNRGSSLKVHEWLELDQYLESDNKRFRAVMQGDGNFVVYDDKGVPTWHTDTSSKGYSRLSMQPDGNLIVYRYADAAYQQRLEARWASGEQSTEMAKVNGQCFARMLDSGALAVFAGSTSAPGKLLWISAPDKAVQKTAPGIPPAPMVPAAQLVTEQTRSYTGNRPVYIVAHRCNSTDMSVVGGHGVNAIEADFRYGGGARATDWYLAHDDVLPTSPTLNEWLEAVSAEVKRPGSSLALLYVDIKTPDGPLDTMFDAIQKKLPELYTVYDIGKLKDGKYLDRIKDRILRDSKAVAAMGFDDSPSNVNQFFKDNGYPLHKYWYEIGLAAGFQWSAKEESWAREAVSARFAGTGPKVAIWSFEKESSVKSWLNEGVDAILVNSSKAFGRTNAFVSDADVHVKNAKALVLPDKYAARSDNALLDFGPSPRRYTVIIKTADKNGAGTDSNIDLEMWGWKNGQEVYVGKTRLNPMIRGNAFERNDTDSVVIQTRSDAGPIFKLKVSSDGTFGGPAWDLEWIKVDGSQFNFNTTLNGDSSTREIAKSNSP